MPKVYSLYFNYATYLLDEILRIASVSIDRNDLALWRDQATACLLFLSGARAEATATLPIKAVHLDVELPNIEQKTSLGVRTKNDKSSTTYLHHVPRLLAVACEWDRFVRSNYPPDYPWFAPIFQQWGVQSPIPIPPGRNRNHALGKRLRLLSRVAGLSYKSPHKYRHGYAVYGLERCKTMAQYHALSRNLMHKNISVTDEIYVHIEERERGRILSQISQNETLKPDDELFAFLDRLDKHDLSRAISLAAQLLANK